MTATLAGSSPGQTGFSFSEPATGEALTAVVSGGSDTLRGFSIGAAVELSGIRATVTGGTFAHGVSVRVFGDLVLRDSRLEASGASSSSAAVRVGASGWTARLAHNQLIGGTSKAAGAILVCLGNYDAGLAAVTCP